MNFSAPCLYAITQRSDFPDLMPGEYLKRLFATPAAVVQWREKDLPPSAALAWARLGVPLARRAKKSFLLNSHVEVALSEGCDGVHLTSRQSVSDALNLRRASGVRNFVVGKSVHSLAEALEAEREGADYVMLGPILAPLSKSAAIPPLGFDGLGEAARRLRVPVAAVGGVEEGLLEEIFSRGAWAAAGISWAVRAIRANLPSK